MNYKDLKLNHYYSVYLFSNPLDKDMTPLPAKYIGHRRRLHKNNREDCLYLFEFIKMVYGHSGYCLKAGKEGKHGHCWFMSLNDIVKELTLDEVMVYEI
jgi:hypothetical protein